MPIYLVDVALRTFGHDYAPFWQAMTDAGAVRALEATWLVDVKQSPDEFNRSVLSHLTPDDRAFIVELRPDTRWMATHLLDEAKDWLLARQK